MNYPTFRKKPWTERDALLRLFLKASVGSIIEYGDMSNKIKRDILKDRMPMYQAIKLIPKEFKLILIRGIGFRKDEV
jgi:hypothetical protein